ncbi:MAG TPA: selenocysteine-specific translation elongation factor [Stellaceae bacterium]
MKTVAVGVVGHVDHGKTALVRALTGTDTDRLKEEKARGISIVLGFAHLPVSGGGGGGIDLIDMPGHERFVRAMVSGATGIEAVLAVVAATEGIKPQTLEHLDIARLIGVRRGVIAVTKCDLVGEERARQVAEEARALLAANGIADAPSVAVSAVTGQGIDELRRHLDGLAAASTDPPDRGFFYLPIDRVFAAAGFGTVVTGTLRRGRIAVGDAVEIVSMAGAVRRARVRGLQVHGSPVEATGPGRRLAVNLRGVERGDIAPGDALATPGALAPAASPWLDVELTLLGRAPRPLPANAGVQLLFGTTEIAGRVRLLDRNALAPGDTGFAQLRRADGGVLAVPAREPFILRLPAPVGTIGGGRILDPVASSRRRRFDEPVLRRLAVLATAPPPEAIVALLREVGPRGAARDGLARLLGASPAHVRRWLDEAAGGAAGIASFPDGTVLDRAVCREMERLMLASLGRIGPAEMADDGGGVPRDRLRAALPGVLPAAAFDAILAGLVARGLIAPAPRGLFRPGSAAAAGNPAAPSSEADRRAAAGLAAAYRRGGLSPPDAAPLVGGDPVRQRALRRLIADGTLVRAPDRVQKREILFHRDAVARAREILGRWYGGGGTEHAGGFLVSDAGKLLGISRKFSVPLLEHLDAIGATRRRGDRRTMLARPDGDRRHDRSDGGADASAAPEEAAAVEPLISIQE